jgi:hypothetical protein
MPGVDLTQLVESLLSTCTAAAIIKIWVILLEDNKTIIQVGKVEKRKMMKAKLNPSDII